MMRIRKSPCAALRNRKRMIFKRFLYGFRAQTSRACSPPLEDKAKRADTGRANIHRQKVYLTCPYRPSWHGIDSDLDAATDAACWSCCASPLFHPPPRSEDCVTALPTGCVEDLNSIGIETTKPAPPPVHRNGRGSICRRPRRQAHILFYGHYDVQPVDS